MTTTLQHQRCMSAIHWLETSSALALGATIMSAVIAAPPAQAQYNVLHTFTGSPADGRNPAYGHLIFDSGSNLYGTTRAGGASGFGVVFKIDQTGETVPYSFAGGTTDGAYPHAGLIADAAGNLYGTTLQGGASSLGVVFKLYTTGKETVLHSFTGSPADGANPYATLTQDSTGNLYGTTRSGGASNYGVVFELDTAGKETVLHSFTGFPTDGAYPSAGRLIRGPEGNLYGTTTRGGATGSSKGGYGVVYKVDTTGKETVLYSFSGGGDGGLPYGGLIRDSAGNLYGTTNRGGANGKGVVFKLDTAGHETVLHSFAGPDGANPYEGVTSDSAGNLYGTTTHGGASDEGVVFELHTTGHATVLYSFTGGADGGLPYAGLIVDSAGNLYGTTSSGGTHHAPSGGGVVFKLTP